MISATDLVRREVHHCASYLVSTLANGTPFGQGDLNDLVEQARELCYPLEDWEEAATQEGWIVDTQMFVNHRIGTTAEASPLDASGWQDLCEEFDIEPYQREIFEHWIVSDWLADKLSAMGEKTEKDFAGLTIWARTTTGQGIANDWCIEQIAREINAPVPKGWDFAGGPVDIVEGK